MSLGLLSLKEFVAQLSVALRIVDCLSYLLPKSHLYWLISCFTAKCICTSDSMLHFAAYLIGYLGIVSTMTWLYHILGQHVMVRAVSTSRHPTFGTCCNLVSRTVMLVANSSSRALRLGSLCKPTHKRHLWELCLSGALQILDLIDWLIIYCGLCAVVKFLIVSAVVLRHVVMSDLRSVLLQCKTDQSYSSHQFSRTVYAISVTVVGFIGFFLRLLCSVRDFMIIGWNTQALTVRLVCLCTEDRILVVFDPILTVWYAAI